LATLFASTTVIGLRLKLLGYKLGLLEANPENLEIIDFGRCTSFPLKFT